MSNNNNQLTEDQKKQKAAVPVATPTASGSDSPYANYLTQNAKAPVVSAGGDEYSKWLETLAKNKKIENTPKNAKTYTDYLVYTGQDPVGDYQAKVRQADLEYRKSLATFGQNAEKMAQAGMTGSGYSDYLTGQAYAQRQGTVQAAQRDANAQMKQSFANYGEYVAGLQAQQEQAKTVDNVELTNALNSVSTMMGNGASIDAAIAGLKGVYSDAVLEQVRQNVQQSNAAQASADAAKYAGYVDSVLNGDNTGIAAYASAAGLDVSAGSAEQIAAVIDHMANTGTISSEKRQEFYFISKMNTYKDKEYSSKDAVNEVEKIKGMVESGKISTKQQEGLLQALGERVNQLFGGVEMKGITWGIYSGFDGSKKKTRIYYNQGGNQNESIDLKIDTSNPVEGDGFKAIEGYTNGTYTLGVMNGKLAIQKDGKVYYADYTNTFDNAGFVAWALTHAK